MRTFFFFVLFGLLFVAALWFIKKYSVTPAQQQSSQKQELTPSAIRLVGQRTKGSSCNVQGALPDNACTPGAVYPEATTKEICVPGYTKRVRNVPVKLKHEVYAEYGVQHHKPGEYEVDHLVPLELGGSNDIANLWPEAADPSPGFHEKDKVENYLHDQVCSGQIELRAAQRAIAGDWLSVYQKIN